MTTGSFELRLGLALATVFAGFVLWQTPSLWRSPLSADDVQRLASELERNIVDAPESKRAFVARVREWAAADDGRAVLLVNLMRYRSELGALPPGSDFSGTPQQANELYESRVAPLALKRGEYPLVAGTPQASSLTLSDSGLERLDRVVVMRAPSRRAFLEFMADPAYGPEVPWKNAATDVVLIPMDVDLAVPDLRWVAGGLLANVYLLTLWRRSERALRVATGRT